MNTAVIDLIIEAVILLGILQSKSKYIAVYRVGSKDSKHLLR